MKLKCEASELLTLIESLNSSLQVVEGFIDLPELPLEIAAINIDNGPTLAGECTVFLEPSDSFRRFYAAVAGNINSGVVD